MLTPAQQELVTQNLPLVRSFLRSGHPGVRALRLQVETAGLEREDVEQLGALGLCWAAEKYDPARGPLAAYARWWIFHAIKRHLDNEERTVRVPLGVQNEPGNVEEIEAVDWSGTEIVTRDERDEVRTAMLGAYRQPQSLAEPVYREDCGNADAASVADVLPDPNAPGEDDLIGSIDARDRAQRVREILVDAQATGCLTEGESKALDLHFGIDGPARPTFRDIGQALGLSRQGAQVMVRRALNKLHASKRYAAQLAECA